MWLRKRTRKRVTVVAREAVGEGWVKQVAVETVDGVVAALEVALKPDED